MTPLHPLNPLVHPNKSQSIKTKQTKKTLKILSSHPNTNFNNKKKPLFFLFHVTIKYTLRNWIERIIKKSQVQLIMLDYCIRIAMWASTGTFPDSRMPSSEHLYWFSIGVPLGTVFTETDRINPSKNDFGNLYNNTGNRNTEIEFTEFFWYGSGITPIKTENTEMVKYGNYQKIILKTLITK